MKSNNKEYFLIFDTNVLYRKYDKKADFSLFSFNSTFNNIIDFINQLDIYEQVIIVIPEVVWKEMEKQIIDAHETKLIDFETYIKKWKFPEYSINKNFINDFQTFIHEKIEDYRKEISQNINEIITISIPNKDRFERIVNRAFNKEPPFGGKEKNSDKGFKDVLIWESILEFTLSHVNSDIIFYTQDRGFKDALNIEFKKQYPNTNCFICSSEKEVQEKLELWAEEIDIYYQPTKEYEKYKKFILWLESGDFLIQLIDYDFNIVDKSETILDTNIHLIDYDNVEESEDQQNFFLDTLLDIEYSLENKTVLRKKLNIQLVVKCLENNTFSIDEVHKLDDTEEIIYKVEV